MDAVSGPFSSFARSSAHSKVLVIFRPSSVGTRYSTSSFLLNTPQSRSAFTDLWAQTDDATRTTANGTRMRGASITARFEACELRRGHHERSAAERGVATHADVP